MKNLLLITLILFLAACSSDTETTEPVEEIETETEFTITDGAIKERDEFIVTVNEYINNSEFDVDLIKMENIEEPKLEENGYYQNILDVEGIRIYIPYNEDGTIRGYHISFNSNSDGVVYGTIMAKSLGLDLIKVTDWMSEVHSKGEGVETHNYTENNYNIASTYAKDIDYFMIFFNKQ